MTRDEAVKILAILKTTFPNSYKGFTKEEALATAGVWAMQFETIPYELVSIALQKVLASSAFAPTIADIHSKLREMYKEAYYRGMSPDISEEQRRMYELVEKALEDKYSIFKNSKGGGEPEMLEMLSALVDKVGLEEGTRRLEGGTRT